MSVRTICCVCRKTKDLNGWIDKFISQYKTLSHGYCPECYEETIKKIDKAKAKGKHKPNISETFDMTGEDFLS